MFASVRARKEGAGGAEATYDVFYWSVRATAKTKNKIESNDEFVRRGVSQAAWESGSFE